MTEATKLPDKSGFYEVRFTCPPLRAVYHEVFYLRKTKDGIVVEDPYGEKIDVSKITVMGYEKYSFMRKRKKDKKR